MEKLLLDVTTVITYISDICNDSNIKNRYGDEWNKKSKLIYNQIIDEEKDPILPKLKKLFTDKELIVPMTALDKAKSLIENYGSTLEQKNLNDFVSKLTIVDDDPSDRIKDLNRKYWSKLNKSVFGTADKMNIKVVTGNVNAINSLINDLDLDLDYIAHRSRCFVGKKFELSDQ